MNILLVAAVVALFVVFVLVLMKLNPSTETKEHREREKPVQMPHQLPPLLSSKPLEVRANNERPPMPMSPSMRTAPIETSSRQEQLAPMRSENREPTRQEKTTQSAKMELTPTRKDCIHHYGYLHSLPKNTPIPDECFGCPKIVDCLVSANSNSNSNSKKRGS